jgi:hypothetical protein
MHLINNLIALFFFVDIRNPLTIALFPGRVLRAHPEPTRLLLVCVCLRQPRAGRGHVRLCLPRPLLRPRPRLCDAGQEEEGAPRHLQPAEEGGAPGRAKRPRDGRTKDQAPGRGETHLKKEKRRKHSFSQRNLFTNHVCHITRNCANNHL